MGNFISNRYHKYVLGVCQLCWLLKLQKDLSLSLPKLKAHTLATSLKRQSGVDIRLWLSGSSHPPDEYLTWGPFPSGKYCYSLVFMVSLCSPISFYSSQAQPTPCRSQSIFGALYIYIYLSVPKTVIYMEG